MCKLWCPYGGRGSGASLLEVPVQKRTLAFCPASHHPEAQVPAGHPDVLCPVTSNFQEGK